MSILSALTFDTKRVTNEGLRRLNLVLALLSLGLGLLVLLTSNYTTGVRGISTSFLSQDNIAGNLDGYSKLSSANHFLFNLNIAYILSAVLLISAAANLFNATRRRKNYESVLKQSTNQSRWKSYILTFGLLMLSIALSVGIVEISLLIAVLLFSAVSNLTAMHREATVGKTSQNFWSNKSSIICYLAPLVIFTVFIIGSYLYGTPLGVYTYIAVLVTSIYVFIIHKALLKPKQAAKDYLRQERFFLLTTFITQVIVAGVIYLGTLS